MSRNAIAAMAVIFVSGFAGCAATARADDATAVEAPAATPVRPAQPSPMLAAALVTTTIATAIYATAATKRARSNVPPG